MINVVQRPRGLAKKLAKLDDDVAAAEAALAAAKDARVNVERKATKLWCHGCQKARSLGDYVYMLDHWYVEPYSCMGGDYYQESSIGYARYVCGTVTRLTCARGTDLEALNKLKHLFGSIERVYKYKGPYIQHAIEFLPSKPGK